MKEEKKIYITELEDILQQRHQCKDKKAAFRILWAGWTEQSVRRKIRSRSAMSQLAKKGWLRIEDAISFCNYCVKDWNPISEILVRRVLDPPKKA